MKLSRATKILMACVALALPSCTPIIDARLDRLRDGAIDDRNDGGPTTLPDGGPITSPDGGPITSPDGGPITSPDGGPIGPRPCGECGAGEECDTASDTCVCAPDLIRTGDSCTGPFPADPELVSEADWTVDFGAVVDATASGAGEALGLLRLDNVAVCGDAIGKTSVTLPPRAVTGPLVVEMRYRQLPAAGPGVELGLGGGYVSLPPTGTTFRTHRVCLDERSYGSTFDLSVRPVLAHRENCATSGEEIEVDRLIVLPAAAGECPEPGGVVDESFSATTPDPHGWQYANVGSATAARVPNGGQANSAAGSLQTALVCATASITGNVTWPTETSLPFPALRTWYSVRGGTAVSSTATRGAPGTPTLGRLAPTTDQVGERFTCVPPWLAGMHVPLRFAVSSATPPTCEAEEVRSALIDSLAFESRESCGSDPYVTGGDFQFATDPDIVPPWALTVTGTPSSARAEFAADTADPANRFMHLQSHGYCGRVTGSTQVLVPLVTGPTGAPALRFTYRTDNRTTSAHQVRIGGIQRALARTTSNTVITVCLPRSYGGRTAPLSFAAWGPAGPPCAVATEQILVIDDVAMIESATCPAE